MEPMGYAWAGKLPEALPHPKSHCGACGYKLNDLKTAATGLS